MKQITQYIGRGAHGDTRRTLRARQTACRERIENAIAWGLLAAMTLIVVLGVIFWNG